MNFEKTTFIIVLYLLDQWLRPSPEPQTPRPRCTRTRRPWSTAPPPMTSPWIWSTCGRSAERSSTSRGTAITNWYTVYTYFKYNVHLLVLLLIKLVYNEHEPFYSKANLPSGKGLYIKMAQFYHEGTYECIARTPLNEARAQGRLAVYGESLVVIFLDSL